MLSPNCEESRLKLRNDIRKYRFRLKIFKGTAKIGESFQKKSIGCRLQAEGRRKVLTIFYSNVRCNFFIVHRPSSIVHCPSSIVHCPLSIVHRPLSIVHCPLSIVRCPLSIVHRPSSHSSDLRSQISPPSFP